MYFLAFNATDLLNFMLIRLMLIAAGVIVVAVVVVVVVLALRRRGRLDDAKRFVRPAARKWAEQGGPVRRTVVSYLEPDDRDRPSR
jgi:hypothetical protein